MYEEQNGSMESIWLTADEEKYRSLKWRKSQCNVLHCQQMPYHQLKTKEN